jgi:AAA family ATP:ADP antiporter
MLKRLGRGVEHLVGSDVHPGEWRLVLAFFVNLFLLLTAYYILKVVREPLILLGGGAVSRSYARGLQAGVLALVIPAYSVLANRLEPDRLVKWVVGFFVITLVAFFALAHAGLAMGFTFFVWLGIFSTLSIAQFWSLATDLLSEADGKRLFPLVAAGGTLGGIVGAQIAAHALGRIDPYQLMLVAAAVLVVCMMLTHHTHALGRRRQVSRPLVEQQARARDQRGGFSLVLHDRYLLLIAVSVVLLNLINTTGDFMLAQLVNTKAQAFSALGHDRQRFIAGFYGDFQTYVGVGTALLQILIVGRLFKTMGVARCLFLLPIFAVAGYGASALLPGLALMSVVKVVENSTDYSLQNTLQQALFLPTSRDAKYKAKAAIDTFLVRFGDLMSTGLVALGASLGLGVFGFALTNVAFAALWILAIASLARMHQAGQYTAPTAVAQGLPHAAPNQAVLRAMLPRSASLTSRAGAE